MLENLPFLAVIIIILWLASLAYYFYTSRKQKDIQQEIASLRKQLEQENDPIQNPKSKI